MTKKKKKKRLDRSRRESEEKFEKAFGIVIECSKSV